MEEKKEQLLTKMSDLEERFRKRTIAFGIAKRASTKAEEALKTTEESTKLISLALFEIIDVLIDTKWCDKCRSHVDNTLKNMVALSEDAVRLSMKYLSGEDTFILMNVLEDPKYAPKTKDKGTKAAVDESTDKAPK